MTGDQPLLEDIAAFLRPNYDDLRDLRPLTSGGWSSAYAFDANGQEYVLRLGAHRHDFEKERIAATWNVPGLPIPEVFELGEAFDRSYIVSRRFRGVAFATLEPARVPNVVERLFDILRRIRTVTLPGSGYGNWLEPDCNAPSSSWADYLCSGRDRDEERLVDWKRKLRAEPTAQAAFDRGFDELERRVGDLPNARQLIHCDLLLNHLIDDHDTITAVFDWGNSMAGDALYDVAWILACIPWFPSIDRQHVLALTRQHFDEPGLERRLATYELHTAVSEMAYLAYSDNTVELRKTANQVSNLLVR